MADRNETELRQEAQEQEQMEIRKAREARKSEARKGEPKVVFTKVAGTGNQVLPEDAPTAQAAKAYREVQLGIRENTPENLVEVGLPHPESQTIKESQVTDEDVTELVFTEDVNTLPKGASGAKIADGVYEIVKGTEGSGEPDAKSVPVDPRAKAAIDVRGSHPVRLEDDTHTNQS